MIEVPATEFAKNFGRYKEIAQREPVVITSHGRKSGYFVSEQEYEEFQRLRAQARQAFHISELSDATIEAISNARMNPKHNHLNALTDE